MTTQQLAKWLLKATCSQRMRPMVNLDYQILPNDYRSNTPLKGSFTEKRVILKIFEGDIYMSGDGAIWGVLLLSLLLLNFLAINFYKKGKMPLWGSGLIIGILGPIIAFISGSVFVKVDHSMGGDGVGAAFGAAFIGLIIVGNGILYFIIGIISVIKNFIKQRNLTQ